MILSSTSDTKTTRAVSIFGSETMPRHDGRSPDQIRPVTIERGFARTSPGSVLYRSGATTVLVTAQLSDKVPPFLEGKGVGWLTAEYAMLPGSTPPANPEAPTAGPPRSSD